MVKLIVCAKRKPGMTHEEFDRYWHESHGPLVRSVPEFIRHVRKYVQCHIVSNSAPLGSSFDYDGVAELWWESEAAFLAARGPDAREAGRLLLEDEAKFIDLQRSPLWLNREQVIYAGGPC